MSATAHNTSTKIYAINNNDFASRLSRNFGVGLGLLTALYLVILNAASGAGEISTGFRFAKHLLIIPIVWYAVSSYAARLPEGRKFKRELGMITQMAIWASFSLAIINIIFFAFLGTSFEQFMQEGETLFGVMINSGFLIFETVVFVMIIGFVILQAYKDSGSPEDE